MISSKEQLNKVIMQDKKANCKNRLFYFTDEIGKYLFFLRKREYLYFKLHNSETFMHRIYMIEDLYYKYRQHKLGVKLGFGIPINAFGSGLRIDHWGFLAVNGNAKIGKNCHIFGDVTIGQKSDTDSSAPIIGDNVTIGAGVRIIGGGKHCLQFDNWS